MVANHKYVSPSAQHTTSNYLLTQSRRFESQLLAVKERLEAAKSGSTRGLGGNPTSPSAGGPFNNNPFGRIAKPLRGGGGGAPMAVPTFAGLQQQGQQAAGSEGGGKRGSWFFNQRT